MKKLYILPLCALLGASAAVADGRFKTKKGSPRKLAVMKAEGAAPLWRPASQTDYIWYDVEEKWLELGTINFTYDANGNAIKEEGEADGVMSLTETEYNEFGMPVSVLSRVDEGDGWENDSKRTYVYDPVIHTFFTERLGFDWSDGEWTRNYTCETNEVTRNDQGNIIEIVKSLPYMNDMMAAYKSVWIYDQTTGQANEFMYFCNYSGTPVEWELYDNTSYRNIIWEATDGQMTGTSLYEMTSGANRLKSCEVYYDNELDGYLFVEYSAETPGNYLLKETFADPAIVGITSQMEIIDENGSFRLTESEYFDEDGEPTDEATYITVTEATYDDHGNVTLETMTETYDGMTELVAGTKAEYTYDNNGNPTELIVSDYDYDTEEYFPTSRIVYADYTDVSAGVDNVAADNATEGYTVYNLQGILVARVSDASGVSTLPAGLYIINGKKHLIR